MTMETQGTGSERSQGGHLPEAWQHVKAAGEEVKKGLAAVLPPDFHQHGRAARREMLLAVRSVIDAALAQVDKGAD
jgi:hypothetical protein